MAEADVDVVVRFFATYRAITGMQTTRVVVVRGTSVAALLDHLLAAYPALAPHRPTMLVAVNQEFAEAGSVLHPGDEVALLPPVSGGSGPCRVQQEPIEPEDVLSLVRSPEAGAVVLFLGTVRADAGVRALDYEAYEGMAVKQMEGLRSAAKERFGVTEVAIAHRTGRLPIGETSVAVACSAPHRQAAFRACEWVMEELKHVVPIWKAERD